jgi:hypothetical protein
MFLVFEVLNAKIRPFVVLKSFFNASVSVSLIAFVRLRTLPSETGKIVTNLLS